VHLGLFGDVVVNERKKVNRSFFLEFAKGEINGYVVKAEKLKGPPDEVYDWRTDILSKKFDAAYVKSLVQEKPEKLIEEILMDQKIFTGSGNIIRNKALYYAGIHPLSIAGKIPAAKMTRLVKEVVKFAHHWYALMEKGKRLSMAVYQKEHAPDGSDVTKKLLKSKRKIFFSEHRERGS
jgi:endonuclease-8